MTQANIVFGGDARAKMMRGADALTNAVKVTLGPRGRNVLLDTGDEGPRVTKDGASIAGQIDFSDTFANMGARLMREVAVETSTSAGDGSTTATVLANSIFRGGKTKPICLGSGSTCRCSRRSCAATCRPPEGF